MRGTARRKIITRSLLAVLATGLLVTSVLASGGVALADVWGTRDDHHGYFDNNFGNSDSPYTCTGHKTSGPVIDNDCYKHDAVPSSVGDGSTQAARKQEVVDYLQDMYNNPGKYGHPSWDKTGASFIVNTMLGRTAGSSAVDRSLDSSEWSQLQNNLNNPDLTVAQEYISSATYGSRDTYYQYGNDDVAYYSDSTESGTALVFKNNGNIVYILLMKCANPLGEYGGLPQYTPPKVWSITPSTSVSLNAANSTVNWTHTVRNNGPDPTDSSVTFRYQNGSDLGNGTGGANTFGSGKASGQSQSFNSSASYTGDDAGKKFCRATSATPASSTDNGTVTSAQECVTIPYDYVLHPVVTVNNGTSARIPPGGGSVAVAYSVTNNGPTRSQSTSWQLTRCVYTPGQSAPSGTAETHSTQTVSQTSDGNCSVTSGSDTYSKGLKQYAPNPPITETGAGLAAGTHICYVMSVNPPSATETGWQNSAPACIAILKTPTVQVWGGDIRAGTITTAHSYTSNGKTYGSWGEYGLFGFAGISGMGSNASLAGGAAGSPSDTVLNALTFANTPTLGHFQPASTANTYYDAYYALRTRTTGSTSAGGAVANNDPNAKAVIAVNGDLTITDNITYSGSYGSPGDIPRVVYVVSGNIKIDPGVTQIDAWLIAKQTLYTCDTPAGMALQGLTISDDCNKQLTFNGPVNVGSAVLARTYGADTSSESQAAEIFNLDPSVFLSNYTASVTQSNIQTVYEKELPPRW